MRIFKLIKKRLDLICIKWYKYIKRKQEFIIKTKEINVKKGKRRYTLYIIETKQGKIKINLGRHRVIEHGYINLI